MELRTDELDFTGRGRVCDLECCENEAVAWHAVCLERELASLRARLEAAEEELADWRASARKAANEECGDEKHCACVGLLKKTLRESFGHQIDMQSALEEAEQQRDAALRELEKANEKLNSRRCNSGHETLPLVLWDCPECVKLIREERDAALRELEEAKRLDSFLRDHADYYRKRGNTLWDRAEAANALLREMLPWCGRAIRDAGRWRSDWKRRVEAHLAASPSPAANSGVADQSLASPEGDGAGRECERPMDLIERSRADLDLMDYEGARRAQEVIHIYVCPNERCSGGLIMDGRGGVLGRCKVCNPRRAQGGDSNAEGSGA